MRGFLDWAGWDPATAQGMQFQGMLGGLGALGAGLMQAGAPRRVGQPGPTMGDAFLAFGQGRQQGLAGAQQWAQIAKEQARAALMADAQSDKPDDAIAPPARALRATLRALPQDMQGLLPAMDPNQVTGLAVQRATQRQRPMTAEELQAAGFRPGTVAFTNDFTGGANVGQQPDVMSPEAMAQRLRLTAAGRGPTVMWRDERDAAGNLIGQRSTTGQFQPINTPAMSPGQAMNIIATVGPRVAAGDVRPGSPDFDRYTAAYTVATSPHTTYVSDPRNPGMLIPQTGPRMNIPPSFPNPLDMLAPQAAAGQAAPQQPAPQAPPEGVPISPGGPVATPPPQSPPGRVSPLTAERLLKGEEETAKVKDAIDNFMEAVRTDGTGFNTFVNNPRDPAAQRVAQAYERVKMSLRGEALLNTGVLQPGENTMLEQMLLSPMSLRGAIATPEAYAARMAEVEKQMLDFYNVRRRQAGLPVLNNLSGVGARSRQDGAQSPASPGGWSIRPVQ